jgi:phosphoenolpyruvate carboxylase
MAQWNGIDVHAEGTGISAPLSEQINLLGAMLGDAVSRLAGPDVLDLVEQLRGWCKEALLAGDDDAPRRRAEATLAELDDEQLVWLLRAFGCFFTLANQAESREIVRINRERSLAGRPESIAAAVAALAARGLDAQATRALLERVHIAPTLTAHPTEARRASVLALERRIAESLDALQTTQLTPDERDTTLGVLAERVAVLLATDAVAPTRPTVADEVEHGLAFLGHGIWESVPAIQRDLRRALAATFGEGAAVPPVLSYRSWIGADRDGNPNVTPAVTRATRRRHQIAARELVLADLGELEAALSISERRIQLPAALRADLEERAAGVDDPGLAHEPFRRLLRAVGLRLRRDLERLGDGEPAEVRTAEVLADLELLDLALESAGFRPADGGRLATLRSRLESFGLRLVALDIRQHSRVHEAAVAELLARAAVEDRYLDLDEPARVELLSAELARPRPLALPGIELTPATAEVLETMAVVRTAESEEPGSMSTWIVSMTHDPSDLLEVLVLAREAGLWRCEGGTVHADLDVVPLFETIDDLIHAGARLGALLETPLYRRHLAARGNHQEVMIGYSDSNKDGGYWMANWALHAAQSDLGRIAADAGVEITLFHGRGGTVGRGGGRAHRAIAALPPAVQSGRIRFTEQGEVISFRYGRPALAHRHLEQIVHAVLTAAAGTTSPPTIGDREQQLMAGLGELSMRCYRDLIDDPHFWPWYTAATPIEYISHLPIASRPVSRKSAGDVDFDGLRAIPWGFAWNQTRYMVPGWFGVGAALTAGIDELGLERFQQLYRSWPFFAAVVDNAERELARTRLPIARRYAALTEDPDHPQSIHRRIASEHAGTVAAIAAITARDVPLGTGSVIARSIALRNPYTDVLNLVQIELLRRVRSARGARRERLREALFLSINAIAAALQSTG